MNFHLVFGLVCFLVPGAVQDPCKNYTSDEQDKRSITYRAHDAEPNICDQHLVKEEGKWYRFQVHLSSKVIDECVRGEACGTVHPIWIQGEHPTALDPGPKEVKACSEKNGDCCGYWNSTIQVKFCRATDADDEDYYVYQLKTPPECDMAYCVGNVTVCPDGTAFNPNSKNCTSTDVCPRMTEPVLEGPVFDKNRGDFYFACKINRDNSEIHGYKREWERYRVVFVFEGKPEDNVTDTDGPNLMVKVWNSELQGLTGKKITCKVRSFWRRMEQSGCHEFSHSNETKCIGTLNNRGEMSLVNGKCVPTKSGTTTTAAHKDTKSIGHRAYAYCYVVTVVVTILGSIVLRYNFC